VATGAVVAAKAVTAVATVVKPITIPHPEIHTRTRKKTIITVDADLNIIDMPSDTMTIITDMLFPIWTIGGPIFPDQMYPEILQQHPFTSIYR
jgi:hypothetical protein